MMKPPKPPMVSREISSGWDGATPLTLTLEGAISVPVPELARRMGEVRGDREIVAYCRGPYCVYALEAVQALAGAGLRARRMEEGFPDWKARGFPVAAGAAG